MIQLVIAIAAIISIQAASQHTPLRSEEFDLNHGWHVENANGTIRLENVTVPSGVYTTLEQAHIIGSLYDGKNDLTTKWIAKDNWTYSLDIPCDALDLSYTHVVLTFHGVDTFADVYFNGDLLGRTNNMFVRYRFDVKFMLRDKCQGSSNLRVAIRSPIVEAADLAAKNNHLKVVPECPPEEYNGECHVNQIRKMQASFSWDWGLSAPSMGIWKPVQIELYHSVKIRDVTFALTEEDNNWKVLVGAYLETGTSSEIIKGTLSFEILEAQIITIDEKSDKNGEILIETILTVPKKSVELWWPNGHGRQVMYNLTVKWDDENANNAHIHYHGKMWTEKTIRIGFRSVELIQEKTDDGLMFYFTINNIPIFMKGSNWIPASILPESSYNENYVKYLLDATRDANMNMLRVWGGGLYESDYFYELADELGILIWHDLMFACSMYPANDEFLANVALEVQQNIRRIQHHPSVAIWATNNENEVALRQNWYGTASDEEAYIEEYKRLYVEVVQPEILRVDKWRTVLISSPSNGDQSTAEDYTASNPQDPRYGDVHYYNYEADGWNPNTYSGGRFISEYGFQSFPALSSWPTESLSSDELTDLVDHRQHSPLRNDPILLMIEQNLPMPSVNSTSYWQDLMYLSQVSQAMIVKTETEVYRAKRVEQGTMGALYWQLNDVWIAPSWSSIEYGGKFKILHYWMKQVLTEYHIVGIINPMKFLDLYMIRDTVGTDEKWSIHIKFYNWTSFTPAHSLTFESMNIPENTVVKVDSYYIYEHLKQFNLDPSDHILLIQLHSYNGTKLSENFVLLDKLKNAKHMPTPTVEVRVAKVKCSPKTNIVQYSLTADVSSPALFLNMELKPEINAQLKQCHFSNNGFLQFTPSKTIYLRCLDVGCKSDLKPADFNVMMVNQFFD
ncbi:beta-mannosidase-like isoform X2 [Topomyia yanbarensis]|nr:beta-mannosidase-like isoform X2 [Topomyia yanbarensis]